MNWLGCQMTHLKQKHHRQKQTKRFKYNSPLASVWNSFLLFSFSQWFWKWSSSATHKDQKKFFCLCTVGIINNYTSKEPCSHGLWSHKFHLVTVLWIELEHGSCCTTLQWKFIDSIPCFASNNQSIILSKRETPKYQTVRIWYCSNSMEKNSSL